MHYYLLIKDLKIADAMVRDNDVDKLYMSVHVLLNLLNKLRKKYKMRGLTSNLSLFRNEFH